MADSNLSLRAKADIYCSRTGIVRSDELLGEGKDGSVWPTGRMTAIKVHENKASFQRELAAYIRLLSLDIRNIAGHHIPQLVDFDEELRVLEITAVSRPFIVDFASA